jgi:hypothetical protein
LAAQLDLDVDEIGICQACLSLSRSRSAQMNLFDRSQGRLL